ncbi:MAG: hypothetical protein F6K09_06640 [Merismopedia sp. SIO2A8]|nr:hypothetical protein [Merismopedia sp. SIO2A8]
MRPFRSYSQDVFIGGLNIRLTVDLVTLRKGDIKGRSRTKFIKFLSGWGIFIRMGH